MARILLIGRWQVPYLHEGHRALIQVAIDAGHTPIIGVRDTKISEKNPYPAEQRKELVQAAFPKARVFIIPDIDEVWVGRDVGYKVIQLSEELESISGTEIRERLGVLE